MEKSDTQERFLSCGKEYFLKYGFKSAPLRKIVAKVGVTTGAFYGYYANKEELFYALTDDAAKGFMDVLHRVLGEMNSIAEEERIFKMCDVYIKRIPEIAEYLLAHHDEMLLILECSQGTKYENFFESLQRSNTENIDESSRHSKNKLNLISLDTMELLMSGYFSILKRIIIEETDREKMIRSMSEVARVYEAGILTLMQKSNNYRII